MTCRRFPLSHVVEQCVLITVLFSFVGVTTAGDGNSTSSTQPARTLDESLVFPGSATQGTPQAAWHTGPTDELLSLTAKDGTKIAAVFGKAAKDAHLLPTSRPTLLFFYGNGVCMANCRQIFNQFRRGGFDVLMPDYEGYGLSSGKPSEAGCCATADASYNYLLTRPGIDPSRLTAVGWSLGSAVAIDLASRRPIAHLVTISAFTNIDDVAQHMFPYAPASILLSSRFDNIKKIPDVPCPILMFHGTQDQLVPPDMCGQLAHAAKVKVIQVQIQGAGHNNIFSVGDPLLFQRVKQFAAAATPQSSSR